MLTGLKTGLMHNIPGMVLMILAIVPLTSSAGLGDFAGGMGAASYGGTQAADEMQQQRALRLQNDMEEIKLRQMQEQERKNNINRALVNLAAQINRTGPKMLDTSTRLDGAVAAPERFTYYFTIVSMQADQISPTLKANMASKLRSTSCNDASLRATLNNGISLGYSYRDRSGIDTFAVTVIQRDCP